MITNELGYEPVLSLMLRNSMQTYKSHHVPKILFAESQHCLTVTRAEKNKTRLLSYF